MEERKVVEESNYDLKLNYKVKRLFDKYGS